ncbi:hypothetical protein EU538_09910 [Candidatus Thorarchaeota archaeon]|nr:MAG: hypothetical protein EU538_09910 [Candidatus Thorarchaeota archaeon]
MELPLIVVHGGAGKWKDERIPPGKTHVERAARIGFEILKGKGSALDAAESCTAYMESCGKLNAGVGARANAEGIKELDAMIVDGSRLQFGSVAAITGIQNPISLARYIMEKTDYNFFAGSNAKRVYDKMIFEGYREQKAQGVVDFDFDIDTADTVGCVAIDMDGRIAATSSTGGISDKVPGRVGDSPVIGAGAYADSICGVSATGYGEHIMRVLLTRMAAIYYEEGLGVQGSCDKAMAMFEEKTGSEAGIIMADNKGNIGASTNAKAMPMTFIAGEGKIATSLALLDEIQSL